MVDRIKEKERKKDKKIVAINEADVTSSYVLYIVIIK